MTSLLIVIYFLNMKEGFSFSDLFKVLTKIYIYIKAAAILLTGVYLKTLFLSTLN